MNRILKKNTLGIRVLLLILFMTGVVGADDYVGGQILSTEQSGMVSGGVFVDASHSSFTKIVTRTFKLPEAAVGNVQWARLYVSAYCGHMQDDKTFTITNKWDGDNDGIYEQEWQEPGHAAFIFIHDGGNDNSAFSGHGTGEPYKIINDHETRVTSDYLMWYDVTDLISGQTLNVNVDSTGSFDGGIKVITLIVAYDDGDSDQFYYWVNQGHDIDSHLSSAYTGQSIFDLSSFSGTAESAILTVNHMASTDGVYAFNGDSIPSDPTTGNYQGAYFGYNVWDVTSQIMSGCENDLTYDRGDASFYKIPLAVLTVRKYIPPVIPVADFSATPLSGTIPLTVEFTDQSLNTPTSWKWEYRLGTGIWTQFSTVQNPSYTFTTTGTYSIRLTATNSAGSNIKTRSSYITTTAAANPDLTIPSMGPIADSVFAKESNTVKITIKNIGGTSSLETRVNLVASDGFSGSETVPALSSNEETIISITDSTVRNIAGDSLTYTATVDPDNTVTELNETNNEVINTFTVAYNGYKGKRYWEGANDLTTQKTYDLKGGVVYSTQPESTYMGVGWTTRSDTWSSSEFSTIPSGSSIEKVLLYISYNWDTTAGGVPDFTGTFNGNIIALGVPFTDKPNFGTYSNFYFGLYAVDVTSLYNPTGDNTLLLTSVSGNSNALYPSTLIIIYSNPMSSRNQIFINEECDELGYSESKYGTTMEEATAYAPFTGMTIDTVSVHEAILHSFVASGGPDEGNLLFNGNLIASNAWQGSSSSASAQVFDVKDYLTDTGNEAGIQGTTEGGILAIQQILVVEYQDAAPVAAFTADPTSGTAPLTVTFTDKSTNLPTSWTWEYQTDAGDWTQFSVEQNPEYSFAVAGSYDIRLTATNAGGSDDETKTGYIMVNEPVGPPVAAFTGNPVSGTVPLIVQFTDESTGEISSYAWDFDNDGTTDSIDQNPDHTYTIAGTYTVKLTVTGPGGSDEEIKTGFITANDESSIEVSVSPTGISFGAMSAAVPSTATTTVSVTTTGTHSWSVTASDQKPSYKGYMTTIADLALENPLELSNDASSWHELSADFSDFILGSGAGSVTETAGMRQAVSAGDPPGDYSITITFTGVLS